jgi:glycine/D-amino acid oxidase-like deaminating enzyme
MKTIDFIENEKTKKDEELENVKNENTKLKIAIIGGGIAGIMAALKLLEDGHDVVLIEKHHKLGMESSAEQHCWGQFGQLYMHLSDEKVALACLNNVKILMEAFKLPGNNLKCDKNGELLASDSQDENTWYRNDPLKYSYLEQPEEIFKKVLSRIWKMHKQGISNDIDFKEELNFSEDILLNLKKAFYGLKQQVANKDSKSACAKDINEDKKLGIEHYTTIKSHDRPMRSENILKACVSEFEKKGGIILTNTEIITYKIDENKVEIVDQNNHKKIFNKIIFATGQGLEKLEKVSNSINTVMSPLLIIEPAICDSNFVKINSNGGINHLYHTADDINYSIIGNGDFVPPHDEKQIEASRKKIIQAATELFPELSNSKFKKTVYFGYKTEFVNIDKKKRNYHFEILSLDENNTVFAAIPGKFTLSPSLAMATCKKISNSDKVEKVSINEKSNENIEVSTTLHMQIVTNKVEENELTFRENRNYLFSNIKTNNNTNVNTKLTGLNEENKNNFQFFAL